MAEQTEGSSASSDKLQTDYANLQAAHAALLERIQRDGQHATDNEEIASLRERVKELESELAKVGEERDQLNSTVRDLRVRVEESRRAIMRLQAQNQSQSGGGTAAGSSSVASEGLGGHNKQDARRSVLSAWNPREMPNGLGVVTTPASPRPGDGHSSSNHTPEELAELKKSKRASLAFGPYAQQGAMNRRMHGHRRIASSGRAAAVDEAEGSLPPSSSNASGSGGLRELHLGSSTVGPTSGTSSKRTSMMGASFFRSPPAETVELPDEQADQRASMTLGSLLMPQRSIRRSSNSSSLSGGQVGDLNEGAALAPPPRSVSRMSQSPSQNSITSPIKERLNGDEEEEEEPTTATVASTQSLFSAQQGHSGGSSTSTYQLQRSLMESKARLRDRDDQITALKRQMSMLRDQLDEASDARAASEACLQALRDFVKAEGGDEGESGALKGVKLPPLPTDKDAEDLEGSRDAPAYASLQSNAASTWKAFGTSLANFSRKQSNAAELESASSTNEKMLPATPDAPAGKGANAAAPASPAAQITTSFGNLWSRATAGTRESASASSVSPSEATSGGGAAEGATDSRHTSLASTTATGPADAGLSSFSASPTNGFKGWFSKRSTSYASESGHSSTSGATSNVDAPTTSAAALRVSSPPFANLDNHVLTLDQVNATPTSLTSAGRSVSGFGLAGNGQKTNAMSNASSPSAGIVSPGSQSTDKEPTGRTKKAMEKSESVDEDNGFVPPSF